MDFGEVRSLLYKRLIPIMLFDKILNEIKSEVYSIRD